MSTTVEWDDRAFKESLTKALSTMKLKSDAEAEVLAYLIANGAKQRAPVKTGRLRASIGVQAGEDAKGKFFDVGTYLNYAPYLEFGTRYISPRAFMRASILEATQNWRPQITP